MDKKKDFIEWILCIFIALILALIIRYYIGTPTIVKLSSMYPTLQANQRLILNRWGRTIKKIPERGDIITFQAPSDKILTENEYDNNNPVAKYEDDPTNWFSKFVFYILEINKESYIKRVIALPGEHVQIMNGKVYINGIELEESYLQNSVTTQNPKGLLNDFVVPEGYVFAMGDNRVASTDCREFGCIPLEKIEGTVWIRFWPFNLFGSIN